MLEELQTLALVGLLVSTYYLIVGCKNIGESLPEESGHISNKIDETAVKIGGMTDVLDDIANLLNEGLQSISGNGATQTASSPMEALLTGFISRMTSNENHGPTTQERTIRKDDSPPTLETENELD